MLFFPGLALTLTCFSHLCRATEVPLILSSSWCKSSVRPAKMSLMYSLRDMCLSWQKERKKKAAEKRQRKRSPKAVNYVLGLPWAVAVYVCYVFLRGYARPPKTKWPNVILFHCITTNMRKKPYTSNGPDFSSFLYYFIRRKSPQAHKLLHLFGNTFSDLHVGSQARPLKSELGLSDICDQS